MKHEELLAKMNYEVTAAEFEDACGDGNDPRVARSLRAVVELHKPVEHAEGTWCSGCMATEWYPCPTIQAIEKELH